LKNKNPAQREGTGGKPTGLDTGKASWPFVAIGKTGQSRYQNETRRPCLSQGLDDLVSHFGTIPK
jgi:hypothetical protein